MDERALAFCGGGAKAIFHIGMWKALNDFGITKKITAVSGTSAGSLNAVLFALGDYENAKKIWYSIRPEMFLSVADRKENAVFSRDGLRSILDKLDLSKLKLPVFVNLHEIDNDKTESYLLNNYSNSKKRELLLASSALPVIYSKVKLFGNDYWDGGINPFGNIPIEPLYQNGYRKIYIASLDFDFKIYDIHTTRFVKTSQNRVNISDKYPDCEFYPIVPLEDLGNFFTGTLNFSQCSIQSKILQGYEDTKAQLSREDFYIMKNEYSKINVQISKKMRQLFRNSKEIQDFINITNLNKMNLEMPTLGGTVWYSDIVKMYGWKLQQHKLIGFPSHYRFLDEKNIRRAWVLNPEDILRALNDYESIKNI